jgi:hypothetical protein
MFQVHHPNRVGITAPSSDSTNRLATTAFVQNAVAGVTVPSSSLPPVDIELIIDGQGSVITSGQHGQIHIPGSMTITGWSIIADQSGSITIDVWRANNAVPSSAGSLVGTGNAPSLSGAQVNSSAPVGWASTVLNANDFIAFNVSSGSSLASVQRVTVALTCHR